MEVKVIWHKQAREALRETAAYIRKNYGLKVREDFRNEVNQVQTLLISNPYMGHEEPLLANRSIKYRSFVINKLNKIVFYFEGDTIHIADFWDTRREPNKQAQQTIEFLNPENEDLSRKP